MIWNAAIVGGLWGAAVAAGGYQLITGRYVGLGRFAQQASPAVARAVGACAVAVSALLVVIGLWTDATS